MANQRSEAWGSRRLSRRALLRLILVAGIGAGAAAAEWLTRPAGLPRYLGWAARGQALRLSGRPAVVALAQCAAYDDAADGLAAAWDLADMPDVTGKRVLVKPNLIDQIEGYPVTTAPQVVAAVVDLLRRRGAAEIAVGDGPGFRRDAQPVAEACGLAAQLAARRVPFVDLNYDDPRPVAAADGWFFHTHQLWLPRHVREADLIVSVPKLKTHHWAGVSLSLKNLFGIVPGVRYGWPKNLLHFNGITSSILGLYQTVRPVVAVVDGIVGMEGDGPLFGTEVTHGLLAVGRDPVAVDATCAGLMGFAVDEVRHLAVARWAGVGQTERMELRGAPADPLRRIYRRPPTG
ncbi:MAG: DUF362 domain-containing protein [Anaerolineae bacterium]|nr:DUF362 domain-containing protein [Anaerolineae bacterium]